MNSAPSPATVRGEDLQDYREKLTAAEEMPLPEQLALLKQVTAELQDVLRRD